MSLIDCKPNETFNSLAALGILCTYSGYSSYFQKAITKARNFAGLNTDSMEQKIKN